MKKAGACRIRVYVNIAFSAILFISSCNQKGLKEDTIEAGVPLLDQDSISSCSSGLPQRFATAGKIEKPIEKSANQNYDGMVLIPAGTFLMGADNREARPDEFPKHQVSVSSFWMHETEVTNAQFREFVNLPAMLRQPSKSRIGKN